MSCEKYDPKAAAEITRMRTALFRGKSEVPNNTYVHLSSQKLVKHVKMTIESSIHRELNPRELLKVDNLVSDIVSDVA